MERLIVSLAYISTHTGGGIAKATLRFNPPSRRANWTKDAEWIGVTGGGLQDCTIRRTEVVWLGRLLWGSGMPKVSPKPGGQPNPNARTGSGHPSHESRAPEVGRSRLATARHFCVEDLPGATIPSARLQKILEALRQAKPVTRLSLEFLEQHGLAALHGLAIGALTYERFKELALAEQAVRNKAATAARQAREAVERESAAAMWAKADMFFRRRDAERLARESDPRYIARVRNRELRASYGIHEFVEPECLGHLMAILNSVDAGQRICAEDYVWLKTGGADYFSEELKAAYHRREAKFFRTEYERTRDPWMAINASSQLRKCGEAHEADALLSTVETKLLNSPRLESAFATTWGGVKRDLQRREEGLRLGERAHALTPDDFRPCTLLGAIHMENGDHGVGRDWYRKAVERGATDDAVDQDLRRIYLHADPERQAALRAFLLADDPIRYAWAGKPTRSAIRGAATESANEQQPRRNGAQRQHHFALNRR
jgi:hypothetical protein